MLKNYHKISQDTTVEKFLKEVNEKKNSHYIILDDDENYVNIRSLSLRSKNPNEKIKNYKTKISESKAKTDIDLLKDICNSGERLIKTKGGIFDFIDALRVIKDNFPEVLDKQLQELDKGEIFVLEEKDTLATAKNLFIQKRINLLPIADKDLGLVGEIRPFDFLSVELFDKNSNSNLYNKNMESSVLSLPVINLANKRALTVKKTDKISEALNIMIDKKLPSLIILEGEAIYSVVSYQDIYKLLGNSIEESLFKIDYSGSSNLFPDDFDLIQDLSEKHMRKIIKFSNYDLLKLVFKVIGNSENSQNRKIQIKANLSYGNHVIAVEKEHKENVDSETDYEKTKWNTVLLTQEVLKILETKVRQESQKRRN